MALEVEVALSLYPYYNVHSVTKQQYTEQEPTKGNIGNFKKSQAST